MKKLVLFIAILANILTYAQDLKNNGSPTIALSTTTGGWTAQPFTTGSEDRVGITYTIEFGSGPVAISRRGFVVDLYDDNNNLPGNLITNLDGDSNFADTNDTVKTYANNAVVLLANTKYHVVMRSTEDEFLPVANNINPITSRNGFSSSRIITSGDGGQNWSETSSSLFFNFMFSITTVEARDILIDDAANVTEGQDLQFTVSLSKASSETITATLATSGTAETEDYSQNTITVTFNPGETSKTVTITTEDDDTPELDETVVLAVDSATGPVTGTSDTGTGVILGNDRLPTVINNLDQISDIRTLGSDFANINSKTAQPFTTSSQSVNSISFVASFFDNQNIVKTGLTVTLFDDNMGVPGNAIIALNGKTSFNAFSDSRFGNNALQIYNADNLNLSPNTTYHIVIGSTQDEFDFNATESTTATISDSFSIGNVLINFQDGEWRLPGRERDQERRLLFVLDVNEGNGPVLSTDTITIGSESIKTGFDKGIFSIENEKVTYISVYDLTGKKIAKTFENSFDFKGLNRGVYIIEIDINGKKSTNKILY